MLLKWPSRENFGAYKKAENKYNWLIGKAKRKFFKETTKSVMMSNRTFWKTLKPSWQMRVVWNDCISIEKDGDITRDEKVLVELFNENYINIVKISSGKKPSWTPPLAVHSWHVATKPLWWWEGWVHWIVFMTSLYMYYIPCFVLVEYSVYIYIY